MNSSMRNISDAELHRFVDGELNAADAREVAELVAKDDALKRRI